MLNRNVIVILMLLVVFEATGRQVPKLWIHDFSPSNKSSRHEQLSEDGVRYLQERLEIICDTLQKRKAGSIQCRASEIMMIKNSKSAGKQKRFEDALTIHDYVIWSTYDFDNTNYSLTTRFAPHGGIVLQSKEFLLAYEVRDNMRLAHKIGMRKVAYWVATELYNTILSKPFTIEHMNIRWEYDTIGGKLPAMCVQSLKKRLTAISKIDPEINFVEGDTRYVAKVRFNEFFGEYTFGISIYDQLLKIDLVDCEKNFTQETISQVSALIDQAFQELLLANNN